LKLSEIAKKINAELIGNPNRNILGISSVEKSSKDRLTFVFKSNFIGCDSLSKFGPIVTTKAIYENYATVHDFLIVENPQKALCDLTNLFDLINFDKKNKLFTFHSKKLHSNFLFVGESVSVGSNCSFGNNVTIEFGAQIGNNVIIGNNVTIGYNTIIRDNVLIESGTVIGSEGFGNFFINSKWNHVAHSGNVYIDSDVRIGANCCIDRATFDSTVINKGVIIDNLVHIAHNVIIGENTAIAAKVGIAGSCVIGKRNMIGGMVGIVDHINTADDVIISATSTVNKDIKEPGTYTGIMPISKHSTWKRIALWILKLDKIAKFLNLKKFKL